MLPVIPKDKFDKLMVPVVAEASKATQYTIDNLDRLMDDVTSIMPVSPGFRSTAVTDKIVDFMTKIPGAEFVGAGSSRVAFFMHAGCNGQNPDYPCCVKISKNRAGTMQTKEEARVIRHFKGLPCFPKLYNYDRKYGMFIVMECGYEPDDDFFSDYTSDWRHQVTKELDAKYPGNSAEEQEIKSTARSAMTTFPNYDSEEDLDELVNMFCKPHYLDRPIAYGLTVRNQLDIFSKLAAAHPMYEPLLAFAQIGDTTIDKGASWSKLGVEDLNSLENWAIVQRGGEEVPIPIDWGFTKKTQVKYYTSS